MLAILARAMSATSAHIAVSTSSSGRSSSPSAISLKMPSSAPVPGAMHLVARRPALRQGHALQYARNCFRRFSSMKIVVDAYMAQPGDWRGR